MKDDNADPLHDDEKPTAKKPDGAKSELTGSGSTESLGDEDVDFTAADEAFLRGEVAFKSSSIKGPTGFVRRRF
jgi:hypothetical protein